MNHKSLDCRFEVKAINADGHFEGYASVWDVRDSYNDIVVKGAFNESLTKHKSNGSMPALLWQHDSDKIAGKWLEMREDDHGLFVKGQLAVKTSLGSDAYELLKMGALSGMSIGYVTEEESFDKKTGINTLSKVALWETSLVTFAANSKAQVTAVKSIEEMKNLGDAEARLRDAGFSRTEATAFVSRVKRLGQGDPDGDIKALMEAMNRQIEVLTV